MDAGSVVFGRKQPVRAIKTYCIKTVEVMHLITYDATMPSVKPRITITLEPQVHEVLKRLSSLTGNSQSSMVCEILTDSLPVFERMVEVLAAAEKLRADAMSSQQEIGRGLKLAHGRVERQLGLCLADLDETFQAVLDAAVAPASVPVAAAVEASAPISNRGVRSTPEAKKKGNKGAGHGSV